MYLVPPIVSSFLASAVYGMLFTALFVNQLFYPCHLISPNIFIESRQCSSNPILLLSLLVYHLIFTFTNLNSEQIEYLPSAGPQRLQRQR